MEHYKPPAAVVGQPLAPVPVQWQAVIRRALSLYSVQFVLAVVIGIFTPQASTPGAWLAQYVVEVTLACVVFFAAGMLAARTLARRLFLHLALIALMYTMTDQVVSWLLSSFGGPDPWPLWAIRDVAGFLALVIGALIGSAAFRQERLE